MSDSAISEICLSAVLIVFFIAFGGGFNRSKRRDDK